MSLSRLLLLPRGVVRIGLLPASAVLCAAGLMPAAPAQTWIQAQALQPLAQGGISEIWVYSNFLTVVPDAFPQLRVWIDSSSGSHASLFLRQGAFPTRTEWDAYSATPGTSSESIVLNQETSPVLTSGIWNAGVFAPLSEVYSVHFDLEVVPSTRPGMGSIPHDDGNLSGTSFRVWAPFADSVHVAGSFNGWSSTSAALATEGNGHWSLDYRGVGAGAEYKYVIRNGAQTLWKNDPRARDLTSSVGNSVVYDDQAYTWNTTGYQTPSWDELVIYEMHVGTFEDTPGGAPGTLASAATRLPYLADLGVNAVELMPLSEFPGDYSWGYNYSHPFAVEQTYGGADALKSFVDQAHAQGIAVLGDVVNNHWGPTDLDLWRLDGWALGNWGGIYFYNDVRAQTPWGDTKPDFGRSEVRQFIRDNALMWLEDFRFDGLRWDSTSTMRLDAFGDNADAWSLMQWANDEVNASQPWKIQIAEDLFNAPNDFITKPTGAGGAGFDSQWEALFVHPVRDAMITPSDNDRNMWSLRDAITHVYNGNALERVIYTESHDEVANGNARLPEDIWPGNSQSYFPKKRSTLAAAMVFTAPGIPMIFQGQEILEDGFFQDTDPVDWSKLVTNAGIHALYRDLIAARRDLAGNTRGLRGGSTNVSHVNDGDKVIAYHRWDQGGPGDDVMVLINCRNQSWTNYRIGLPAPGTWQVRFNSDWNGYDASFGNHPANAVTAQSVPWDGMPHSAELSFGAYTALILSQ